VTVSDPVTLLAVRGLPEVDPGADLATLIAHAVELRDGDVVVVAQKVVSKAEAALVAVGPAESGAAARRRAARRQAVRVVAETPSLLIVETRHGLVCANAGVDASNVRDGWLALLPADPDASARRLRADLGRLTGRTVAVIVADTFGRPWRLGQTDVAIGAAGIGVLRDERGRPDRQGRRLEATQVALADELAAAADLVRGKADGVPVVVVRGLAYPPASGAGARELVRPAAEDLFRRGTGGLLAEIVNAAEADPLPAGRGAAGPGEAVPGDGWRGGVPAAVLEPVLAAIERVAPVVATVTSAPGRAPTEIALHPGSAGAARAWRADPVAAAGLGAGLLVAALVDLGYRAAARGAPRRGPAEVVVVEAGLVT
jgi:coenzyme F420-0:L-glutamate ligase/coenzyme F420-1:gamma-L-glutamate ligase